MPAEVLGHIQLGFTHSVRFYFCNCQSKPYEYGSFAWGGNILSRVIACWVAMVVPLPPLLIQWKVLTLNTLSQTQLIGPHAHERLQVTH